MANQRVVDSFVIDELIGEMKELIQFYEEHFDYKKIRSSKIQKWIDELTNPRIEQLKKFEYYFQLRQYVRAMQTFKKHSEKIKKDTIKKCYLVVMIVKMIDQVIISLKLIWLEDLLNEKILKV